MPAKPKPRDTDTTLTPVQFRFEPDLVNDVDAKVAAMNVKRVVKLTRSDVARALLRAWANGRIKIPELA